MDGKRAAETVFEKHLEAGAEDALLFQFQGPKNEVCRGRGCGDFELLVCPLADREGGWVLPPCGEGGLLSCWGRGVGVVRSGC